MKHVVLLLALVTVPAWADGTKPSENGTLIGPDGKIWRVEGCAAYPVEQAGAQKTGTRPQARLKMSRPKLAQSKPAKRN